MHEIPKVPLETWHFFAFLALLALLGALGHVARALFNPLPDRLSDSDAMDVMVSSGYDWNDYLFGTEYDDAGYYRLDSIHNLRLAIIWSMIGGAFAYLISEPDMAHYFAWAANNAVGWFKELVIYRFQALF